MNPKKNPNPQPLSKEWLDDLYRRYNRKEYVHPDPLEFLYRYSNCADQELVGLVASSLAYGRVEQILRSVDAALKRLGGSPHEAVQALSLRELKARFAEFKHRFTTGSELASLLWAAGRLVQQTGSLGNAVADFFEQSGSLVEAQTRLVRTLLELAGLKHSTLLPDPSRGSACKRLNLYFRWMVRKDEVDVGCWEGLVPRSCLLVPLDTHMFAFARRFGLTARKSADLKAVLETTAAFARLCPEDPTKYDFAITRAGIAKLYEL